MGNTTAIVALVQVSKEECITVTPDDGTIIASPSPVYYKSESCADCTFQFFCQSS